MKNRIWLSLIFVAMIVTTGCSGKHPGNEPLPRRQAFPRLQQYSAEYAPAALPIYFPVNSGATSQVKKNDSGTYWLTVNYPLYGASLFCTFTPVKGHEETARAVDNRMHRIQLNIADAPTATEQNSNDAYTTTMVRTRTVSSTPLQFLIYPTAEDGWVISGAAFFPGIASGASLDSISPAIDAIATDVRHALTEFHQ